jgi:hypothetical protein
MILFQAPYLTIEYDQKLNCVSQHWKGYAKSEQFRAGIEKSVEFFKQKRAVCLISNTKELAVVSNEDTQWAATYATPLMMSYGLKYVAFIVPTNVFAQLSVNNFKNKTEDKVQLRYFTDLAKAKAWFQELQSGVIIG